MSPPSHLPTPLASPATIPPSSSAPLTQAQSANPMSISSILAPDPPRTPLGSGNPSRQDGHAAGGAAPQGSWPELATPPASYAALPSRGRLFQSPRRRTYDDAHDECARTLLTVWTRTAAQEPSAAAGQGKGKGKDPELYDTELPSEDGNAEPFRSPYLEREFDAATGLCELGTEVRILDKDFGAAVALWGLHTEPYECNVCTTTSVYDGGVCTDCLHVPWSRPPAVVKHEDDHHLYSSGSEDEGPPLPLAPKATFTTCCHGNYLSHSAHEGNAVFDLLLPLRVGQTPPRSLPLLLPRRRRRDGLDGEVRGDDDDNDGEADCRHCQLLQGSVRRRYEEGYRRLGVEAFVREETVPLSDDDEAPDCPAAAAAAAAADGSNGDERGGGMASSLPRLSKKTLERLEAEKRAWRAEPDPLPATCPVPCVSVVDADAAAAEPIRLPLYAEESAVRTAITTAPDAPPSPLPPAGHRRRYTDPRSGQPYPPLASDFVPLATILSRPPPPSPSPSPSPPVAAAAAASSTHWTHRRFKANNNNNDNNNNPSPLKQVENADDVQTCPSSGGSDAGLRSKRETKRPSRFRTKRSRGGRDPAPAPSSSSSSSSSHPVVPTDETVRSRRRRVPTPPPPPPPHPQHHQQKGSSRSAATRNAALAPATTRANADAAPPPLPRRSERKRKTTIKVQGGEEEEEEAKGKEEEEEEPARKKGRVVGAEGSNPWFVNRAGDYVRERAVETKCETGSLGGRILGDYFVGKGRPEDGIFKWRGGRYR